jgi:hypothetical protein
MARRKSRGAGFVDTSVGLFPTRFGEIPFCCAPILGAKISQSLHFLISQRFQSRHAKGVSMKGRCSLKRMTSKGQWQSAPHCEISDEGRSRQ